MTNAHQSSKSQPSKCSANACSVCWGGGSATEQAPEALALQALTPGQTVVVATGNPHKVAEIKAILGAVLPGVVFRALGEVGEFPEPKEDGETFFDNALIKARAAANETGFWAVADDSGLVVDALGGEPGVRSARWAGVHGDDEANNAKLIAALAQVPAHKRTARFCSTVCLVSPKGRVWYGEGVCEGHIGFEPKGKGGFGYDPLFWPQATPGQTMAELAPEQKNTLSHRYFALKALAERIGTEWLW